MHLHSMDVASALTTAVAMELEGAATSQTAETYA